MQPFLVQLYDLTIIQLMNWRWSYRSTIITGMVAPVFSILALSVFATGSGEETLGYILTGNIVLSLLFSTMGQMSAHFAFMREVGRLEFFATLPISRAALVLASVIAFMALALPSTIATLLVGWLVLRIPLHFSPMIIIVIPLIAISLSGLGALIGLLGRTPQEVGSVTMMLTFLMTGLGPVVIPASRLPDFINTLSMFSPATYAASALRQTVLGWSDPIPLPVDVLMLFMITGVFLWLVGQKLDWRVL